MLNSFNFYQRLYFYKTSLQVTKYKSNILIFLYYRNLEENLEFFALSCLLNSAAMILILSEFVLKYLYFYVKWIKSWKSKTDLCPHYYEEREDSLEGGLNKAPPPSPQLPAFCLVFYMSFLKTDPYVRIEPNINQLLQLWNITSKSEFYEFEPRLKSIKKRF